MFTLLKLIKPFFMPPTLIIIGLVVCIVFQLRKKQKFAVVSLVSVFLIYYLLSIEPVAYFLAVGLECESNITEFKENSKDIEVIIVLSGGATKQEKDRKFSELNGPSWRRFWKGIEVFREFEGQIPILYSGGSGDLFNPISIEGELARKYAISMGIPEKMFWIESKSRNTFESGIEITRILGEHFPEVKTHKVVLITSALHMQRALGVIKKLGLHVIPKPADFAISSLSLDPFSFLPTVESFSLSYFAIHEWIGNVCYKLLGRI